MVCSPNSFGLRLLSLNNLCAKCPKLVNTMPKGQMGGRQPGAGRPKGSLGKRTQELIAKAAEQGITPLEVLLDGMRHYYNLAITDPLGFVIDPADKSGKILHTYRSMAKDYAVAAAPYIHPKLASLQANVKVQNIEAELAELE